MPSITDTSYDLLAAIVGALPPTHEVIALGHVMVGAVAGVVNVQQ